MCEGWLSSPDAETANDSTSPIAKDDILVMTGRLIIRGRVDDAICCAGSEPQHAVRSIDVSVNKLQLDDVGFRRRPLVSGASRVVAEETKSHVPYEAVLPSALTPRLERYLDVHRPVLMRGELTRGRADTPAAHPEHDALWVSDVGTHLEAKSLAGRIVAHTKAAFGQSVSPHLFRDAAATSIAIDNPKHIGDASLVLGHADHSMTEKHYNHARSLEASRKHAATLAQLRRSLTAKRRD